jgi:hypothetical protein
MLQYKLTVVCFLLFKMVIVYANPIPNTDNGILIKANESTSVKYSENIILECTFNKSVQCGWQRRGVLINPGERYAYIYANGKDTYNCSLRINNVQELDLGEWICETLGTSETKSELGSIVQITRKNPYGSKITTIKAEKLTTKIITPKVRPTTTITSELDSINAMTTEQIISADNNPSITISILSVNIVLIITAIVAIGYLIYRLSKPTRGRNSPNNTSSREVDAVLIIKNNESAER